MTHLQHLKEEHKLRELRDKSVDMRNQLISDMDELINLHSFEYLSALQKFNKEYINAHTIVRALIPA